MSLHRLRLAVPLIAGGLALACGASKTTQNQQTTPPPSAGSGQLALSLVDAPPDTRVVKEIWIKVTEVNVHHSGSGWVTVFPKQGGDQSLVVNLLDLTNGNQQDLGFVDLAPGTVTQVRLVIDPTTDPGLTSSPPTPAPHYNTVVLASGAEVALKVPSGAQSGIKIHGPWNIEACQKTTLTIDFDGKKSIWYHPTGQGDLWILRPVIRAKNVETVDVACAAPQPPTGPVACDPTAATPCANNGVCLPNPSPDDPSLPDNDYCAQPPNSSCTVGLECISGSCDPATNRCSSSEPGQPCYANGDCESGACDLVASSPTHNTCQPGGGGATCDVGEAGDCQSGTCEPDAIDPTTGTCTTPPPPPDACAALGAPGAPCTAATDCLSGTCDSGFCGQTCDTDASCDAGMQQACVTMNDCGGKTCLTPVTPPR